MKRKLDEHEDARKRLKTTDSSGSKTPDTSNSPPLLEQVVEPSAIEDLKSKEKKEESKDSSKHHDQGSKRLKMTDSSGSKPPEAQTTSSNSLQVPPLELEVAPNASENISKGKEKESKKSSKPHDQGIAPSRRRINKLVPPRPFPTVPSSVSATGPRTNHKEGKNLICITRKTSLACYLRRCKDIIIKDG